MKPICETASSRARRRAGSTSRSGGSSPRMPMTSGYWPMASRSSKGSMRARRGGGSTDCATLKFPSGGVDMRYELTPINTRPWLLNGLSLRLIESHYENHYGGALRRLNAITEQLESLDFAAAPAHRVNGLKREQLVALNSTLLHELYFACLGGEGGQPPEAMASVLARYFGSA